MDLFVHQMVERIRRTHNLSFTQFSGAGQITAGNGLEKSGNTLSIDAKSNSGIVIDSTRIIIRFRSIEYHRDISYR